MRHRRHPHLTGQHRPQLLQSVAIPHDYTKTHFTAFDLLDKLCGHHHAKKTRDGWALIAGNGKRPFVPPHDPRHPRHSPQNRPPPSSPP